MRVALVALCLIAAGCGQSVDLSKPVSVDALLTEWGSNAGRVREWDGKQVTVTGPLNAISGGTIMSAELLGRTNPKWYVHVKLREEPPAIPLDTETVATGRLLVQRDTLRVVDATIKVSGR